MNVALSLVCGDGHPVQLQERMDFFKRYVLFVKTRLIYDS